MLIKSSSDLSSERALGGIDSTGEEWRSLKTKEDVNDEPRFGM
jgi:hypothetical protein